MLRLERAAAQDRPFLYELYAEVRCEEFRMLGWDDNQLDVFLRMQYDAQQRSYLAQYPDMQQYIVYMSDMPAGQITSAEMSEVMVLVDMILLPEYRNRGIGTELLAELQEQARTRHKPIRLHVLHHNPARRLYERMGFRATRDLNPYLAMEWAPLPV